MLAWVKGPFGIRHEQQAKENIDLFAQEIVKLDSASIDLSKKIELHNKYEDYIIKSRQANHPWTQVYGPLATAAVSAIIAFGVLVFTLISYLIPSQTRSGRCRNENH